MAELSYARYGKDNVKVCKVIRDAESGTQTVIDMTVSISLEGAIETSYTKADNSCIVATDTQKRTVYILAKQHPVTPIELFASILGDHFIKTYRHIHGAHVKVVQHKWSRMTIDGALHPHSFVRDGDDVREAEAYVQRGTEGAKGAGGAYTIEIKSAMNKLLLLKSTGSQFHGFIRDDYTQLPETWDRILSTEVDCQWKWNQFAGLAEVQEKHNVAKFDDAHQKARLITLETFAKEESASVQATMYKIAEQMLAVVPDIENVALSLPNKHYFEIDLSWFKGMQNTGKDAEVYAPQTDPNGLIHCLVSRKGHSKK